MDLPSDLLYFVSQIENYSKNTVKLQTLNQNTLGTNGQATQMRLSLPVSSIVNLKSLSMHCTMQTYGLNRSAAGTADAVFALVPRGGIAAVLDRVSWTAGGIALDSGPSNYALQYTVKSNLEKSSDKYMSDDRVLAQSTLEAAGAYDATSDSPAGVKKQLVQNNFLGFTEAEPCYMDMSLLPECFMTLQIADSSALPVQYEGAALGAPAAIPNANWHGNEARFQLQDIFFTCEVVSVANGLYSKLQAESLAERGSMDVPFKSYQIFSVDTPSAAVSLRGSVSTMSLDRCYGFFRNAAARDAMPILLYLIQMNGGPSRLLWVVPTIVPLLSSRWQPTAFQMAFRIGRFALTTLHILSTALIESMLSITPYAGTSALTPKIAVA